jgi:aspartyl-tRNA(Asn)/glutamyl-tRNA(Gln) amidotransferase subunit A
MRIGQAAQFITIGTEASAANADLLAGDGSGLGPDIRLRFEIGQCFLASDYVKAQRIRRLVRDALIDAMGDADAILVPTLPCAPPVIGQSIVSVGGHALPAAGMLTRFTSPFNMTGLPALSLPCGFDEQGLPVSIQVVGRPGQDAHVLSVGRWLEKLVPADALRTHDQTFD